MVTTVILLFLFIFPVALSYTDASINLLVYSISTSSTDRYCIELAKLPNNEIVDIEAFGWYKPYYLSSSVNACDTSNLINSLPNKLPLKTILILYEHDCKMTEHAWNVESYLGKEISLMIITKRTNTRYALTYNTTTMPITIPVLVFWEKDFVKMSNKHSNLSNVMFSIDYPPRIERKFRPTILLMFILVLFVLLCGNFWAADEFKNKVKAHNMNESDQTIDGNKTSVTNETIALQLSLERNSFRPNKTSENSEPAVLPITYCVIILIICFAVGWLLLLYYFPKVMIYILQGKYLILH